MSLLTGEVRGVRWLGGVHIDLDGGVAPSLQLTGHLTPAAAGAAGDHAAVISQTALHEAWREG